MAEEQEQLTELQKQYAYSDPESLRTQELQPKGGQENAEPGADESEPAEDQETGTPPAEARVSQELFGQAVLAGISPEEAGAFGSDEELQRTLNIMARSQQPVQQKQPGQKPPSPEAWKAPKIELSDEDVDESVVKQFNKLNTTYEEQIVGLKNDLGTMADMLIQSQKREQLRDFDENISRLPEATRKKLGSGPSSGMMPGQPGYVERGKLITMMDGLAQARPDMPEREAFNLAVTAVLGAKRQRSAGIARPNTAAQSSVASKGRARTEDERMADLTQRYKEMVAENG